MLTQVSWLWGGGGQEVMYPGEGTQKVMHPGEGTQKVMHSQVSW